MWKQIHGRQREQLRSKASKLTVFHALFTQTHGVFTHFSRFFTHVSTTCFYHDVWSTDITARIQCPTKVESAGLTGTLPKFKLNLHVEDQGNMHFSMVIIARVEIRVINPIGYSSSGTKQSPSPRGHDLLTELGEAFGHYATAAGRS